MMKNVIVRFDFMIRTIGPDILYCFSSCYIVGSDKERCILDLVLSGPLLGHLIVNLAIWSCVGSL